MKNRLALSGIWLLCAAAGALALILMAWAILTGSTKAWEIAVAFDRVGNTASNGKSTETISSRAARGTREGNRGWCLLCRLLDKVDPNHCAKSEGT